MTDAAAAASRPVVEPAPVSGALALLAVVPIPPGEPAAWEAAEPRRGVRLVAHGGLAALVWPVPAGGPGGDASTLVARHEEVHRALLRGTVAPAPLGITFPGPAEVERFLADAGPALQMALTRVGGRWEFRLHAEVLEPGLAEGLALDLVTHVYAELRRVSAAAIPFSRSGKRLLSAGFLVDRATSTRFRDRVDELARLNSGLSLDLTGPWPPYDFVQMHL